MADFETQGVRFSYPENWTLADETSGEKIQVTVQSPQSAFWTLVVLPDAPGSESMLASVEEAYREDYPEGDIYPREESAEGRGLRTRAEFVCLDLVISVAAESFTAGERTAMVLTQAADIELEQAEPVFDAMTASLEIDDDRSSPRFALRDALL